MERYAESQRFLARPIVGGCAQARERCLIGPAVVVRERPARLIELILVRRIAPSIRRRRHEAQCGGTVDLAGAVDAAVEGAVADPAAPGIEAPPQHIDGNDLVVALQETADVLECSL